MFIGYIAVGKQPFLNCPNKVSNQEKCTRRVQKWLAVGVAVRCEPTGVASANTGLSPA